MRAIKGLGYILICDMFQMEHDTTKPRCRLNYFSGSEIGDRSEHECYYAIINIPV